VNANNLKLAPEKSDEISSSTPQRLEITVTPSSPENRGNPVQNPVNLAGAEVMSRDSSFVKENDDREKEKDSNNLKRLKSNRSRADEKDEIHSSKSPSSRNEKQKTKTSKQRQTKFKRFLLLFVPCISTPSSVEPPEEKHDLSENEKPPVEGYVKNKEINPTIQGDSTTVVNQKIPESISLLTIASAPPTITTLVESGHPTPTLPRPELPSTEAKPENESQQSSQIHPNPPEITTVDQDEGDRGEITEEEVDESEEYSEDEMGSGGRPLTLEELIRQGGFGIPIDEEGNPRPLLPPIVDQEERKKCLVLDLDETLVHSYVRVRLVSFFRYDDAIDAISRIVILYRWLVIRISLSPSS
jgi:hypothetical protein